MSFIDPVRQPPSASPDRRGDFAKLWAGQMISLLGSQVTSIALPLTAALALHASAAELGLMNALGAAPALLFGLILGASIDRVRRRPVLIATDLARAAILASIPLAAALHRLTMLQLDAVVFLAGLSWIVFDAAFQAYLPSIVPRERLVEANGRLGASVSAAQIVGSALGGTLVELLTAPLAIAVDAASFLVSAASMVLIRGEENGSSEGDGPRRPLPREIGEGLALVVRDPRLRSLVGATVTLNLFGIAAYPVFVLFQVRELRFDPATFGIVAAAWGPGALLGSLLSGSVARRHGVGQTMRIGYALLGLGFLGLPATGGPVLRAAATVIALHLAIGVGNLLFNVSQTSLRQAIVPDRLLGRVAATQNVLLMGAILVGSIGYGLLGEVLGLRSALVVSGIGTCLGVLWLIFSPV